LESKEVSEGYSHSENLHMFIKAVVEKSHHSIKQLEAVMIGNGPGSFTGLRIGSSAAKGICFSLGIPLMSASSLLNLAKGAASITELEENARLCPMIDARRMDVYQAIYDKDLNEIESPSPLIVDEHTFTDLLSEYKVYFFGDGSDKLKELYKSHENASFLDNLYPSSKVMGELANQKFEEKDFEDVAYFTPHYLKDFQATTPKKQF
jgi:tRNA threonylcarbamoyladenosine biosynthesis protein TsaB